MTAVRTTPHAPGPAFEDFLAKSRKLEGVRLADSIPREYFTPRPLRGVLAFTMSWGIYAASVTGLLLIPFRPLYPLLIVLAGLGGWGLHCIAHDCGHGSFSHSRTLNGIVGQAALMPLIYPFHSWRHVHNMHHAHTNHLELDTDWRPLPPAFYHRMSLLSKVIYVGIRTWGFWGGTIQYWAISAFRPNFFPKASMRRDVRRSIAVTAPLSVAYLGFLYYLGGLRGLLLCFVLPWLAIHLWFSTTTLMHHSASDVPYLTSQYWTRNASKLLVTTDFVYPPLLAFLTHNIATHTAHHVAPAIPFYNLPKAQAALKTTYPTMVREQRLHPSALWSILRDLHIYDEQAGFYRRFSRASVGVASTKSPQS